MARTSPLILRRYLTFQTYCGALHSPFPDTHRSAHGLLHSPNAPPLTGRALSSVRGDVILEAREGTALFPLFVSHRYPLPRKELPVKISGPSDLNIVLLPN